MSTRASRVRALALLGVLAAAPLRAESAKQDLLFKKLEAAIAREDRDLDGVLGVPAQGHVLDRRGGVADQLLGERQLARRVAPLAAGQHEGDEAQHLLARDERHDHRRVRGHELARSRGQDAVRLVRGEVVRAGT